MPPLLGLRGEAATADHQGSSRAANSLLGEITSLVWGAFKNRYIGPDSEYRGSPLLVPLLIDRINGKLSFGTENPQLRFLYTLSNANGHRLQLACKAPRHCFANADLAQSLIQRLGGWGNHRQTNNMAP